MKSIRHTSNTAVLRHPSRQTAKYLANAALCGFLLTTVAFGQGSARGTSCETLAKTALPNTSFTAVEFVRNGEWKAPQRPPQGRPGGDSGQPGPVGGMGGPGGPGGGPGGLGGFGGGGMMGGNIDPKTIPDFCRIAATLTPTSDSRIRVEVWLPAYTWNGKFIGVGGGGMAGNISYSGGLAIGLADAVKMGYAAANTDAGHDASEDSADGIFLYHHPEKMVDFSYRANHEMTLLGKTLVRIFYGKAPSHSYFIGCSLGSMQALNEAHRYPEDYDGVIAGAPMEYIGDFNAAQLWPSVLIAREPAKFIPAAKYQMLHEAVLKVCTTVIGKSQGFVDEPESCHFDPTSLQCKDGDQPDCFTPKQIELVKQIYAGPVNPRTGKSIYQGPAPGAEGELNMYSRSGAHTSSVGLYRYEVEQNPDWDWKTMDFDKDVELADKVLGPLMYTTPEDLRPFLERGGKLLLYVGWQDYHNPEETSRFYEGIQKVAGPAKKDSARLFNVPGMNHCQGGPGCDAFNKIEIMDQWVTSGKAPNELVASKVQSGKVSRTRPVCAYPMVSKYKGTGSFDEAANYQCTVLKTKR